MAGMLPIFRSAHADKEAGDDRDDSRAPGARTIGMCPLDGRDRNHPNRLPQERSKKSGKSRTIL